MENRNSDRGFPGLGTLGHGLHRSEAFGKPEKTVIKVITLNPNLICKLNPIELFTHTINIQHSQLSRQEQQVTSHRNDEGEWAMSCVYNFSPPFCFLHPVVGG
jgi:hypothetical protein